MICGSHRNLETHEIANGPARQRALDEPATWLRLCGRCHRGPHGVHHKGHWPIVRQLALKKVCDSRNYDRVLVNRLRGRADDAITEEEVDDQVIEMAWDRLRRVLNEAPLGSPEMQAAVAEAFDLGLADKAEVILDLRENRRKTIRDGGPCITRPRRQSIQQVAERFDLDPKQIKGENHRGQGECDDIEAAMSPPAEVDWKRIVNDTIREFEGLSNGPNVEGKGKTRRA